MFDANECALDWFPNNKDVLQYSDLLIDLIVGELPDILSNEYEPDRQYRANFMSVHKSKEQEEKASIVLLFQCFACA